MKELKVKDYEQFKARDKVKTSTVRVIKNLTSLVEAICLLTVSGFSIYAAYHYQLGSLQKDGLLFAGLVIALRGSWEFLQHLNKN